MSCDRNTPAVVDGREEGKEGGEGEEAVPKKKDRGRLTFDRSDVNYFRG